MARPTAVPPPASPGGAPHPCPHLPRRGGWRLHVRAQRPTHHRDAACDGGAAKARLRLALPAPRASACPAHVPHGWRWRGHARPQHSLHEGDAGLDVGAQRRSGPRSRLLRATGVAGGPGGHHPLQPPHLGCHFRRPRPVGPRQRGGNHVGAHVVDEGLDVGVERVGCAQERSLDPARMLGRGAARQGKSSEP